MYIKSCLQSFFGNIYKQILYIGYKDNILRFGECCFIGDKTFLNEVKKALNYLKEADPDLYNNISNFKALFLYQEKCNFMNFHANIFAIPIEYRKWFEYGIVLYIYHIYLRKSLSRRKAIILSAEWIKDKGAPKELINNYLALIKHN